VRVTQKEVTGTDNAVNAVISEPIGVVTYGAVKMHRMEIKPPNFSNQKNSKTNPERV
jgi:hypothetical protein